MKAQVYKDPRDPSYFTRFHKRVRDGRPDWVYTLVRMILTPYLLIVHRARALETTHVPEAGQAIIAPNHFSFLDHFFVAVYLRRKVHFMAKSQLFKRPMQFIYTHGGVFPVRRGFRDEEAFETAHAVLSRGDIVLMYPEGGRSRTGELGEPKRGLGRLALESGAPVVPVAIVGTQKARNWKRLSFPKVTVLYGEPVRFDKIDDPTAEQQQQAAELVFERVKALYDGLREGGRKTAIQRARQAGRAASQAADAAAPRMTIPE
ncbi:MAG: 1-acyl-sn-glycerol-3-phosphate acyltransferase [Microbacteriaceae bacterium]|nr:1-acyl-sn-glycerol-3-phosphate acyltransferase [Microbacteriaceae bacterium]MEA2482164.1 1-acyl-sn-glycerol-3-phosphate acyltransferase [Thermoleophilaceae bacterium]